MGWRSSLTDRPTLTERQQAIYEFIRDKIRSRGYGPTVREIGDAFEIRSPNGVMCHLRALEKKGLITREANMSRAIQLTQEGPTSTALPLRGRIAAGVLHEAVEQEDSLDLASVFGADSGETFALEVHGDSMIEAQIDDGDYVVIRRQETARHGDMVVAQTEDGEATLKYWKPERSRIKLEPANRNMDPIYVQDARVLGVVVGVVRRLL